MNWKTKIWIEMLFWAALAIGYWAWLLLSSTFHATFSSECIVGYVLIVVAEVKVQNRWKQL